jgi:hypothetical protein
MDNKKIKGKPLMLRPSEWLRRQLQKKAETDKRRSANEVALVILVEYFEAQDSSNDR